MIQLHSPTGKHGRLHRIVRFRENDDDELLLLCNFIRTMISTETMICSISRGMFIVTEISLIILSSFVISSSNFLNKLLNWITVQTVRYCKLESSANKDYSCNSLKKNLLRKFIERYLSRKLHSHVIGDRGGEWSLYIYPAIDKKLDDFAYRLVSNNNSVSVPRCATWENFMPVSHRSFFQ